jgi:zinc protease
MRRPGLVPACLAAALGLAVPAVAAGQDPVLPHPIRTTTLDNGLMVVSVGFDSPGLVACCTVIRAGRRIEAEPGHLGLAHVFQHLVSRGTTPDRRASAAASFEAIGADSSAFTTDDGTYYQSTLPSSLLAKAIEVEADRFRHFTFDEASFRAAAVAFLRENDPKTSTPVLVLDAMMRALAYARDPNRPPTAALPGNAAAPPPVRLVDGKTFFERWYRPENCAVVAAGDVDHEALVTLARRAYGDWKRGMSRPTTPGDPPRTAPRSTVLRWPRPTPPVLYLGYHIPAGDPADPDAVALRALAEAVFGVTSPLFQALVLDEHKVVELEAQAKWTRGPGLFTVMARLVNPDDLPDVRSRIESALAQAAQEPVAGWRLESVRDHLRYRLAGSLDSAEAVARAVARSIAITGRPDAWDDVGNAYQRLTAIDLQRVAGRYFAAANQTAVTLVGEGSAR